MGSSGPIGVGEVEKQVIIVGVDESEESRYALESTLDRFFTLFTSPAPAPAPAPLPSSSSVNCPFNLVIVHVKPPPSSSIGFAGPAAVDVLPYVDADLKKGASRVVQKAKDICSAKKVNDVVVQVMEGDAKKALCEAVQKHHASILVLGSHGHNAIKRVILGSVSDYCSRHAPCTVMIVKKPKIKH